MQLCSLALRLLLTPGAQLADDLRGGGAGWNGSFFALLSHDVRPVAPGATLHTLELSYLAADAAPLLGGALWVGSFAALDGADGPGWGLLRGTQLTTTRTTGASSLSALALSSAPADDAPLAGDWRVDAASCEACWLCGRIATESVPVARRRAPLLLFVACFLAANVALALVCHALVRIAQRGRPAASGAVLR